MVKLNAYYSEKNLEYCSVNEGGTSMVKVSIYGILLQFQNASL